MNNGMLRLVDFIVENNIHGIVDIGANNGMWSYFIHCRLPEKYFRHIHMFEANPDCEPLLKQTGLPYTIAVLSEFSGQQVKLYKNPNDPTCTGTSLYLEQTRHYNENNYVFAETKSFEDAVTEDANFGKLYDILDENGQKRFYQFAKLDTQGSELDIIRGSEVWFKTLSYIQLEVSLEEYNKGAPLQQEVFDYMKTIGFEPILKLDDHYHEGRLIQVDYIFENTEKPVRNFVL